MPGPFIIPPKRSLGIFSGLSDVLDSQDQRKAAEQKAQQMLEDRLISQQQREAQNKSRTIEDALHQAQADALRAPKPTAQVQWHERETEDGSVVQVNPVTGEVRPLNIKGPKKVAPQEDRTLVPVQQEDGTTIYMPRQQAAGKKVPGPNNTGAATISKAVAANRTQLSVIDDAVKELDSHPSAVGLTRGLPVIGDRLDPRMDPNGVAARAQIANIGSLKIHDRSGAAVSVHEFPRLAPFIPLLSDPPEAIRTKLKKLREAIEMETNLLSQGTGPSATKPSASSGDPEFDALMAKYKRPPV